VAIGLSAATTRRDERGFPLFTIYSQNQFHAGSQTFGAAQDSRGLLHFANLAGILTFDGASWHVTHLPNESAVFSIAADDQGRVAAGGFGEIGYLTSDASSEHYHSLVPLLPAALRDVGEVRSIAATPHGFLFLGEHSLLFWDGASIHVAEDLRGVKDPPSGVYRAGGNLYLAGEGGLSTVDATTLRITPIDPHPVERVFDAGGERAMVVRRDGLFILEHGTFQPFAPAASQWLAGKRLTDGRRLMDGRFVLATHQDGLLILHANGDIDQLIDRAAGLPEYVLAALLPDREGSLWIAMYGPIARIDLASPVSILDSRSGLKGMVRDILRFGGHFIAVSSHGLFTFDRGLAHRIEAIPGPAWSLLPAGKVLVVGTSHGMFTIDEAGNVAPIAGTERLVAYAMLRSKVDPSRVWLGMRSGVGQMHLDGSTWRFERALPGVPTHVQSLIEQNGALWCGTVFDGVIRVDEPLGATPRVTRFGGGEMNLTPVGGRILASTPMKGRIVEFTATGLRPDHLLGKIRPPNGFFRTSEDAHGNVWLNSSPPRIILRHPDGTYDSEGRPLVSVDAADIQFLKVDDDGVVWFGSDQGLYRYEPSATEPTFAQPPPLVRSVIIGDGTEANGHNGMSLPHAFRRLRIELAPASYRPGILYQYRLDGLDFNWSRWTQEPFVDFTNLAESDYTFRARTRGAAGNVSKEAHWSFTVLPPWYRTVWAFVLWIFAAIGVVLLIVRIRTRTLSRHAEHLRRRVSERTKALRSTVEQLRDAQRALVHKNERLEQANARLERMSLVDELTGIANRRYFQRALSEEWDRARANEQPLALILLDLDSFKELNDTHGHPAGDACLRAIGTLLGDRIRRSGDVAARYGGEEFVILLAGMGEAEAVTVAEGVRLAIESVTVTVDGAALHVTASCGVAAIHPAPGERHDVIIDRADRALYAAKHAGRNCVRFTAEPSHGTWLRETSG
jgi:diguanylate cyclase (GGDEF)-like protein